VIDDPNQLTYLELRHLLEADDTFRAEALEVLKRDYARPQSTYTVASSAGALLEKWVQSRKLLCYNERGEVVLHFSATLHADSDGDYTEALEAIESSWLIRRVDIVQLIMDCNLTVPKAVAFQRGPDSTLAPNRYGYTVDGAARAITEQFDLDADSSDYTPAKQSFEDKWAHRIFTATLSGVLRVRDPQDGAYYKPATPRRFWERISTADLNAWLAASGTGFRLDIPEIEKASAESGDARTQTHTEVLSPACTPFRAMKDLNPGEITIEIASGDSGGIVLNISARAVRKRVTLQELDLFDRRKAQPNKQGLLLIGMASGRRMKSVDNSKSQQMSRLRESLRKHLGMAGNPFGPYSETGGYVPRFELVDKRNAAKDRAEQAAIRNTGSLNSDEVNARVEQSQAEEYQRQAVDDSENDEAEKWLRQNDRTR
jgi:hypothetical protein